jgi:hypothetical protein
VNFYSIKPLRDSRDIHAIHERSEHKIEFIVYRTKSIEHTCCSRISVYFLPSLSLLLLGKCRNPMFFIKLSMSSIFVPMARVGKAVL